MGGDTSKLTVWQQHLVDTVVARGPCTTREVAEADGKHADRKTHARVYKGLKRLQDRGLLAFVDNKFSAAGGAQVPTAAPGVLVPAEPKPSSLVIDPWGEEVTEERARRVMADAVKGHLDQLLKKDPEQAVKDAYVMGAYMTGRPLPNPTAVPVPRATSGPSTPEADGRFVRLELPKGWDYEVFWPKASAALSDGKINAEDLARELDLSTGMVDKVLRGKQEPTRDMLERFYAACYRVI